MVITLTFCKEKIDLFDFHINRFISGYSNAIFSPMARNCSCMYKISPSTHCIEDLSCKICNPNFGYK